MTFIIVALIIACLWGLQPILQKNLLKDFSSHSILILTNIIFTICLIVYGFVYREIVLNDLKKLEPHHWKLILFSAIICSFLTSVIYFELIKNHKSTIIMALTYSAPIFTVLFSEYLLKENVDNMTKLGIGFVVLGIFIISYYGN